MKTLLPPALLAAGLLCAGIVSAGTGGPDTYGYTWVDALEPNGPAYQWIAPTGNAVNVVTESNLADRDRQC